MGFNNTPIPDHPLIGKRFTYHAEYPPYVKAHDTDPGTLLVANGMRVVVLSVFKHWNGFDGLNILYVFVPATGLNAHIIPGDLGLGRISTDYERHPKGHDGQRLFDTEFTPPSGLALALSDCQWYDKPMIGRPISADFDCWGRVGKTGDGIYSTLCEGHLNGQRPGYRP